MKSNLDIQQTIFKKQNNETEKNTKVSYIVSYLIAKKMKPFAEREFIKEYKVSVVREVCPKKKGVFEKAGLSARIVTRRTEGLAEDVNPKMARGVNLTPLVVFRKMYLLKRRRDPGFW